MALKRRTKVNESFSMASMTDVIFLLLIFFMVTSTRRDSERHQGDAPTGTKADCCQATDACHDRCESELLCRFR